MALRRFYLEASAVSGDRVLIHGDLFHHIRDVCRFSVGDEFEILIGDDQARLIKIQNVTKRELTGTVLSCRSITPLSRPHLTLALSIPKLPKVDEIIEKCVELGVSELRPFISDYSFLRQVEDLSSARRERWEKIVHSATQQSGRGDLLKIAPPTTLSQLLVDFNQVPATGGLFSYEGKAQRGLREALRELKMKNLDQLWVFVGSEGGFSLSEVEIFKAAGLESVSLGAQILRVETACLALVSIIKYETGNATTGDL